MRAWLGGSEGFRRVMCYAWVPCWLLAGRTVDAQEVPPAPSTGLTARESTAVQQISSRQSVPILQLATGAESHGTPVSQVYQGGRTAAPAAPLSTRSEGKPGSVAHLQGHDKCDPRAPDKNAREVCATAIETRSAEFARPDITALTPEQKLLVDQRLFLIGSDAQLAIRRIGRNEVSPDDPGAQSLASLVLSSDSQHAHNQPDTKAPDPALSQEAIDAIQQVTGTPR
jgi:hypothetical protein